MAAGYRSDFVLVKIWGHWDIAESERRRHSYQFSISDFPTLHSIYTKVTEREHVIYWVEGDQRRPLLDLSLCSQSLAGGDLRLIYDPDNYASIQAQIHSVEETDPAPTAPPFPGPNP